VGHIHGLVQLAVSAYSATRRDSLRPIRRPGRPQRPRSAPVRARVRRYGSQRPVARSGSPNGLRVVAATIVAVAASTVSATASAVFGGAQGASLCSVVSSRSCCHPGRSTPLPACSVWLPPESSPPRVPPGPPAGRRPSTRPPAGFPRPSYGLGRQALAGRLARDGRPRARRVRPARRHDHAAVPAGAARP